LFQRAPLARPRRHGLKNVPPQGGVTRMGHTFLKPAPIPPVRKGGFAGNPHRRGGFPTRYTIPAPSKARATHRNESYKMTLGSFSEPGTPRAGRLAVRCVLISSSLNHAPDRLSIKRVEAGGEHGSHSTSPAERPRIHLGLRYVRLKSVRLMVRRRHPTIGVQQGCAGSKYFAPSP